jgi:AraC family transcriptional regulator
MTPEIVVRRATLVVGMRIRTVPMSPEIPALWPRFVARIPDIAHPAEPHVSYGVMAPAGADMAALDYLAGIAVHAAEGLAPGLSRWTIPAGTWALFHCRLDSLPVGYAGIFNEWLPASDFAQASGPLFERYDEAFDPTRPDSLVEIGVPVVLNVRGG